MGEEGEERPADFDQIVEITGLDPEQVGDTSDLTNTLHHYVDHYYDTPYTITIIRITHHKLDLVVTGFPLIFSLETESIYNMA